MDTSPDVHDTIILDKNRPHSAAAYMVQLILELCSQQATALLAIAAEDFDFFPPNTNRKEKEKRTLFTSLCNKEIIQIKYFPRWYITIEEKAEHRYGWIIEHTGRYWIHWGLFLVI